MLDELAIWLVPIVIGTLVVQYYAWELIGLYIAYFLTVRLLERIPVSNLKERAVVITGCDSGFGHGLTLMCLEHGMTVFSACFNEAGENGLKKDASHIPDATRNLHTFSLDVRSDESVQKAREVVEGVLAKRGIGLWGIVNNAGIGDQRGWDDWSPPAQYERNWQVNTLGVIRVTHAFVDLLKKTKGRIVNVSSITGKFPMPAIGPYSVSKYAVAAYNDICRMEYANFGITVCILEPGFFKTPQANPNAAKDDITNVYNRLPQHKKDEYGEEYQHYTENLVAGYLDYKCKPTAHLVVEAYFNALTSAYPRRRYQIGYDSIFQFTPLSYLPSRVQDWLLRGYFMLVAKPPKTKAQKEGVY